MKRWLPIVLILLLVPTTTTAIPVGEKKTYTHSLISTINTYNATAGETYLENKRNVTIDEALEIEITGTKQFSDSKVNFATYNMTRNGTVYDITIQQPFYYDTENEGNYLCPYVQSYYTTETEIIYPYFYLDFSTIDASCVVENMLFVFVQYPNLGPKPNGVELTNKLSTFSNVTNMDRLIRYTSSWADLKANYSDISLTTTLEIGGYLTDQKVGYYFSINQSLSNKDALISNLKQETDYVAVQFVSEKTEILFDRSTGWLDHIYISSNLDVYEVNNDSPSVTHTKYFNKKYMSNPSGELGYVRTLIEQAPPLTTSWLPGGKPAPAKISYQLWFSPLIIPILLRRKSKV